MTVPTPDAHSSRPLPPKTYTPTQPARSMPDTPPYQQPLFPATPPNPTRPATESREVRRPATDFASHSWDLATGGLKTLTAKRELPLRIEQRTSEQLLEQATQRSYAFALMLLVCALIMLISGGIVLFLMIQP